MRPLSVSVTFIIGPGHACTYIWPSVCFLIPLHWPASLPLRFETDIVEIGGGGGGTGWRCSPWRLIAHSVSESYICRNVHLDSFLFFFSFSMAMLSKTITLCPRIGIGRPVLTFILRLASNLKTNWLK